MLFVNFTQLVWFKYCKNIGISYWQYLPNNNWSLAITDADIFALFKPQLKGIHCNEEPRNIEFYAKLGH